jgi:putative FmdB family regulatory protein
MAEYEFQCQKCSQVFTLKQTFQQHDKHPRAKCPKCGSSKANQLYRSVHVKTAKKS